VNADVRTFETREDLANALADAVADALSRAVARRGTGFLAVSGGTTPSRFFSALSTRPIAWDKVTITLVDERMVPPTSDRSNEKLVRSALLTNDATAARFVGLCHDAPSVEAAAGLAERALSPLSWPLDAAILGMGTDGHTASFFPDATKLDALLSLDRPEHVMPVEAASAGESRLTLPLARLVEAGFLAVHIEGDEKQRIIETALKDGSTLAISAVLRAARSPVPIYWAP
jgi:6-phosphogluconolactonase